jgi:hypothetical protein
MDFLAFGHFWKMETNGNKWKQMETNGNKWKQKNVYFWVLFLAFWFTSQIIGGI